MSTSNKPASGGFQADNPRFDRPLSPHLQIWRWHITMTMSILHRVSGVALSVGAVVLTWWLIAAAVGGEYYEWVAGLLASPVGLVFLAGWSLAFFYHLGNGIRHLLWDAGWGFKPSTASTASWFILAFTIVATALTWWCAWARIGGAA